jgi:DNA polymerase-3 subunit epsilon
MRVDEDLEALARRLEEAPDYRILRRLSPRVSFEPGGDRPIRRGAIIDLETTGLDPRKHEIIELAIVPFSYTTDGTLVEVHEPFHGVRQPAEPIPPGITRLTGITNEMVAGQTIAPDEVAAFVEPLSLIIAHRATFDRPFAERFCDAFVHKAWACSESQIDWSAEGFEGTRLFYLAIRHGLFFDGHRALDDCQALVELLARPLPRSGSKALAQLLAAARRPTCRIWALNAPYDSKDCLKMWGYRWNDGSDGRPRAWYYEVPEEDLQEALNLFTDDPFIGPVDPFVQRLDAYARFSDRW